MQPQTFPGKNFSVTGMILGICSVVLAVWLGFVLGVLAIIFSTLGLKKQRNGFAIAGLVTGIVGTAISILVFLAIVAGIAAGNAGY